MRATYVVIDLLQLDGRDLCGAPLEERRVLLGDLVAGAQGILREPIRSTALGASIHGVRVRQISHLLVSDLSAAPRKEIMA